MAGRFITLEGGEGSGKSTQVKRLAAALEAKGITVLTTREPGGSPGAEEIRALLVQGEPGRWDPLTETLLLYAARADHVRRVIGPALLADKWVISDRFTDSTYVYQGIARGVPRETIRRIDSIVLDDFKPDFTLVLDIDVDTTDLLPPDDSVDGFDNVAQMLTISPVLLERYLSASAKITRLAVGDPAAGVTTTIYHAKPDLSQDAHVDGLPIGTVGGLALGDRGASHAA